MKDYLIFHQDIELLYLKVHLLVWPWLQELVCMFQRQTKTHWLQLHNIGRFTKLEFTSLAHPGLLLCGLCGSNFKPKPILLFWATTTNFWYICFVFFGNNPPHISGFFGCRRTTPASKYLGHPLTSARWQDYVSTSVPRAAEEDCSRDRFSARKLPKNIEEGGWRTEKSPIKWALKWENHPTKWRIFRQAMFDYQKVTLRFNDEFTGNHVFYCWTVNFPL